VLEILLKPKGNFTGYKIEERRGNLCAVFKKDIPSFEYQHNVLRPVEEKELNEAEIVSRVAALETLGVDSSLSQAALVDFAPGKLR
jgi:hypothetical protein